MRRTLIPRNDPVDGGPAPPSIPFGPRVRKSPYFAATLRYGARSFTVYNHMYMPTGYTDPVTEYRHLVEGVTLWDVACQRQVEISGPDAYRFMQYLTPRNMSRCGVGQCWYLLLTDERGGIVNDAVMLHLEEDRFWLSPGDGDVLMWVLGVAVDSGLAVDIHEPDVSPLQLQGPRAPYVIRELFGEAVLSLGYYGLVELTLDGMPLVVSRTGWSGELGYEMYLQDHRLGDRLWETVMEAGAPYGITPAAPSIIRSIEGGLLSYASDLRRCDDAFLVGVDKLVDLDQPDDFIGKSALRSIRDRGVARRLAGIEIEGAPMPGGNSEFWPATENGAELGHVTRCTYSPRLDRNIGYANLPVSHVGIGTPLVIVTEYGPREATVCDWPWFPAQKTLPADLQAAAGP